MVTYSLTFQNNSKESGNVCVYLTNPDSKLSHMKSLVWFSRYAHPTTVIGFNWKIEFDFVWSKTGELGSGILFSAGQTWPANLSDRNQVTLTQKNGAYTFMNQTKGPDQGFLYIMEDSTIPLKQASVGIGMSGRPFLVVQAQPDWKLVFQPNPNPDYWITFGKYKEGEVLDINQIPKKAKISFPENIYSMTAILTRENTWIVKPTSQVNAEFLDAKKRDSKAEWGVS